MKSGEWKVGDRVTLSTPLMDAQPWMVGHPATVIRLNTDYGGLYGGPKLRFDPVGPDHDCNTGEYCDHPHACREGWWVDPAAVIPLVTVETSHDIW